MNNLALAITLSLWLKGMNRASTSEMLREQVCEFQSKTTFTLWGYACAWFPLYGCSPKHCPLFLIAVSSLNTQFARASSLFPSTNVFDLTYFLSFCPIMVHIHFFLPWNTQISSVLICLEFL